MYIFECGDTNTKRSPLTHSHCFLMHDTRHNLKYMYTKWSAGCALAFTAQSRASQPAVRLAWAASHVSLPPQSRIVGDNLLLCKLVEPLDVDISGPQLLQHASRAQVHRALHRAFFRHQYIQFQHVKSQCAARGHAAAMSDYCHCSGPSRWRLTCSSKPAFLSLVTSVNASAFTSHSQPWQTTNWSRQWVCNEEYAEPSVSP